MNALRTRILASILLVYGALLLSALYTQGNFLLDVFISLLPYWIVVNIGLLAALFVTLFIIRRAQPRPHFLLVSMAFLSGVTVLLLTRFASFAYLPLPSGQGGVELKVAFLNKLYSNTNYAAIDAALAKLQPDIIGFSEIKPSDIPHIRTLATYQCSFVKSTRNDAAVAFYSKYPCSLVQHEFTQDYILPVTVEIHQHQYRVFVIHPLPPGNNTWTQMRNAELGRLASFIRSLTDPHVLVLGDFNLSPWSPTYTQFASVPTLKDTARGEGALFTWHGDLIQTQIDHIFVPRFSQIRSFNTEYIAGSDHNLIWTSLKV